MKKKSLRVLALVTCLLTALYITACRKGDEHEHTYSDYWTYDAAYHWKGATCEHLDEYIEKSEHIFENKTVIPPTYESEGYTIYTCSVCGYEKQEKGDEAVKHNYSNEWSYDSDKHWHACTDKGYESLRADEAEHTLSESVIKAPTPTETGLGRYTCSVCGLDEERVIRIPVTVEALPTVEGSYYVGQPLSQVKLAGGKANVDGVFAFTDETEKIKANGEYSVTFTPTEDKYAKTECKVSFPGIQLTVSVNSGENGKADPSGVVNVDYDSELSVIFTPNFGYAVGSVIADGKEMTPSSKYTFENIKENHTLSVSFKESENKVEISCTEGSENCYTVSGSTITFSGVKADSVYTVSGEFIGNIVIDVGDQYNFELEMQGLRISSDSISPIVILSGNKVTLSAKKDTDNYINDMREAVDDTDEAQYSAAVYALCDLDIQGKGRLTVVSENNNGIHTKDDLEVQSLTLSVTCEDNALKGNDSVTVKSGNVTLIAKAGDTIKTTNTSISEKGKQKGTVTISGGTLDLYAACDGINAAYDAVIDGAEATVNIYTDSFSEYSKEVSKTAEGARYIRFTSKNYNYSVKYYNSDSDFVWVNATYEKSVQGGRSTYYYYTFESKTGYDKVAIFIYSADQKQGQEEDFLVATDYISWNEAYDTFALRQSGSSLSYSWANISDSPVGGGMGGPGGGRPGAPGGMGGMDGGNNDKLEYSAKGIKAGNSITVNNGNVNIKAYDDAIHANADTALENGASPTGNVTINGGNITIYTNDDGIHADGTLLVTNGTVKVDKAYEGLEGIFVRISGGNISVESSDDGVNATTRSGQAIVISGGNLYIYAKGDGIDSNSTASYEGIVFSGGNTTVISTSGGNSAIDSERGYSYLGGNVLAIMPSGGMSGETTNCQNFSSVATKTSMSLREGQTLTVSVGSNTVMSVNIPSNISGMVVYLGSNTAKFS